MNKLKTVRGQSARITQNDDDKFFIELYANGTWVKPCSGYDKEFNYKEDIIDYFDSIKNAIHC